LNAGECGINTINELRKLTQYNDDLALRAEILIYSLESDFCDCGTRLALRAGNGKLVGNVVVNGLGKLPNEVNQLFDAVLPGPGASLHAAGVCSSSPLPHINVAGGGT
jgi:hypothetical protein